LIKQDYSSETSTRHGWGLRWIGGAVGVGLIAYALFGLSNPDASPSAPIPVATSRTPSAGNVNIAATEISRPAPLDVAIAEDASINEQLLRFPEPAAEETASHGIWLEHQVRSGDTMSSIFSDLDLDGADLHQILQIDKQTRNALTRIKPGQRIQARVDEEKALRELIYEIDATRSLRVLGTNGGFEASLEQKPTEKRVARQSGVIRDSLFLDGQKAGLSDPLIMELANIFGWDIDFALEIREGDRFSVIYREYFLDGKKLEDGPILAAEFVNRGKTYRAIRYENAEGHSDYYTPEGKSVRKAFLRMPVKFGRISSRFSLGRKHPILNRIRAHKGVDYAAPTGTPIRAAGDGKISFRGRKGGYGKTIVIEHGGGISTLYAHMSKYTRSRKGGSRVKQGEIIGYVGKTGLATGPHLHYEFRLNGVHRNPLTVKLPAAKPIDQRYRADFLAQSQDMIAQLERMHETLVADAQ
jgi:murein DD-endopeptidase MepM/ murein hydrolase activator NlpD